MLVTAKLFSALYVNTAVLYIKRLGRESHSSLSNMIVEGVIKSALKMIRAARERLAHMQYRKGLHQQYRHKVETHPATIGPILYAYWRRRRPTRWLRNHV